MSMMHLSSSSSCSFNIPLLDAFSNSKTSISLISSLPKERARFNWENLLDDVVSSRCYFRLIQINAIYDETRFQAKAHRFYLDHGDVSPYS
jgi:hypothetical protein